MVLSPSLVSQTGDDCDLVGTSFSAFRNQVVSLSLRRGSDDLPESFELQRTWQRLSADGGPFSAAAEL